MRWTGVQATVTQTLVPTVGLAGLPQASFSPPPSVPRGAVHANGLHPVTAQPLPKTWCWSSAHTTHRGGWGLLQPWGEPWKEASAETTHRSLLRGLCQS